MSIINEQIAGYTAKMQELFDSFNDDFPLVSENLKELDKIVDQIENISFMNSNARTFLQKVEYQKMYGIMPSEKDLDNLFFLTDLRRAGKNEILFVDQLQLSQNLYTLALSKVGRTDKCVRRLKRRYEGLGRTHGGGIG